jgi:hypothetical protein
MKLVTALPHARSRQMSTWTVSTPLGSTHRKSGSCDVTVAVDSGAICLGTSTRPMSRLVRAPHARRASPQRQRCTDTFEDLPGAFMRAEERNSRERALQPLAANDGSRVHWIQPGDSSFASSAGGRVHQTSGDRLEGPPVAFMFAPDLDFGMHLNVLGGRCAPCTLGQRPCGASHSG